MVISAPFRALRFLRIGRGGRAGAAHAPAPEPLDRRRSPVRPHRQISSWHPASRDTETSIADTGPKQARMEAASRRDNRFGAIDWRLVSSSDATGGHHQDASDIKVSLPSETRTGSERQAIEGHKEGETGRRQAFGRAARRSASRRRWLRQPPRPGSRAKGRTKPSARRISAHTYPPEPSPLALVFGNRLGSTAPDTGG